MNWTRRRTLTSLLGVATTTLAGCLGDNIEDRALPETPTGTWRQIAHDAGNTSVADVSVPSRATPAWETGRADTIQPVVAGDQLFSVDGKLRAFETQTGDQLWQTDPEIDDPVGPVTTPAVTAESVILGTENRLVAFAREDGTTQWERPLQGMPSGPVTVDRDHQIGIVPVERLTNESVTTELRAFELSSGDHRWSGPLRISLQTTPPTVFDKQVVATGYTDDDVPVLRAFGVTDGEMQWEQELDDPETPPVTVQSGVFVGDGGTLRQYSHSGEQLETVADSTDDQPAIAAIAVADETAFVLSGDGLSAVSIPDRTNQWHFDANPQADGICVGQETVVAPVSSDEFDLDTSWPCIAAFDRSDGTVQWYHAFDDAFDPVTTHHPLSLTALSS